jgi:microcystin-dependent protein
MSRTTYNALFSTIGTAYGAGDGVNTFNLPDLRQRFPKGSSSVSAVVAGAGGSTSQSLTLANMPAHSHTEGSLVTSGSGTHTHDVNDPGHTHGSGSTGSSSNGPGSYAMITSGGLGSDLVSHRHTISTDYTRISLAYDGDHTHTITGSTGSAGSGSPITLTPPYQTVHYFVRT